MIPEMCDLCPGKPKCSALCPEAEAYVRQDHVSQREIVTSKIYYGRWPEIERPRRGLTKTEKKIFDRILDGKNKLQICKDMGITGNAYDLHISRMMKKFKI